MSIQGATVHPKLSDAAMSELRLIADFRGISMQAVAEELLHRALLGESYAFRLAVDRAIMAGTLDIQR